MRGIEAMFDAMQHLEGHNANDRSRLNRNPLNLRASAVPHTMDAGYCVFADIVTGTTAGIHELWAKISGNNAHKIGPDSTLEQLYDVYAPRADSNDPNAYAVWVANWCTKALGRPITTASTLKEVCPELFSPTPSA